MSLSVESGAAAEALFARRVTPIEALADHAGAVATTCHAMARRFHRGARLLVFGNGGAATDAQHIAVEFVHPVIVGKPALPAQCLAADVATVTGLANRVGFDEVFAHQVQHLAAPEDIALGVSADGNCGNVVHGLRAAQRKGLLTVAMVGGDGGTLATESAVDHLLHAETNDPLVVKEVHVTMYHLLWELVHVLLEQPGVLAVPQGVAA